jgi:hypothetical protein
MEETRSGKIVTVYTNRLFVFGATATTEFVDYTVDSIKVQGKHVILNQGEAISTSPVLCIRHKWKVTITDAKLTNQMEIIPNGIALKLSPSLRAHALPGIIMMTQIELKVVHMVK